MLCGRFLQEVGYEDVFNQDEISEIKDLYEKAHQDLADFDKPAVEKEEKVQEAPAADAKVRTGSLMSLKDVGPAKELGLK